MNKKFKVKATDSELIIDSVINDFAQLGKRRGKNKVVVGAGIGLAVISCSIKWEVQSDSVFFNVTGSHGLSGFGIVFVLFSMLFGCVQLFFFSGILMLLIIYYLEVMHVNQKISEGIDEIKFRLE
jgi:hypothetical protein